MPIAPEHAFKETSTKLLILLPLRIIYNCTFQCETPCRKWNVEGVRLWLAKMSEI